jgi:hypothetical protein
VRGRVIVHSTLVDLGARRDEKLDDLVLVVSVGRECRDDGWKAVMVSIVRIGAEIKQRSDERKRTVVDRVLQAVPGHRGDSAVQKWRRRAGGRSQGLEIAVLEGLVDS